MYACVYIYLYVCMYDFEEQSPCTIFVGTRTDGIEMSCHLLKPQGNSIGPRLPSILKLPSRE